MTDTEGAGRTHHSASRTKSLGHARRESIQARRLRRAGGQETQLPEETEAEMTEAEQSAVATGRGQEGLSFLKGFNPFSTSTTTSQPLPYIRSEFVRVFKQLGVDYTEIKGGYSCRHAPSIDLNKEKAAQLSPAQPSPSGASASGSHRRKISFGGFMGNEREREEFRESQRRGPPTPSTPRHRERATGSTQDQSYSDKDSDESGSRLEVREPKDPRQRVAGETTTHVRDDLGQSMALRFEILIVKVPLLKMHGIQFRKLDGNIMHYKNMAQEILKGIRL